MLSHCNLVTFEVCMQDGIMQVQFSGVCVLLYFAAYGFVFNLPVFIFRTVEDVGFEVLTVMVMRL
jgi:hypothetical protein